MAPPKPNLVNLSEYSLKGINYYWTRRERYDMSVEELNAVGVCDEHAYLRPELVAPLQEANVHFQTLGYELIVKDAYRSPELYLLIQKKRYALHGKAATDRLLNVVTMPHATGLTVDVNLIEMASGEEVKMRNPTDDSDGGLFINYYGNKPDEASQEFQRLQDLLVEGMTRSGFRLGSKKEFWHFEYPLVQTKA